MTHHSLRSLFIWAVPALFAALTCARAAALADDPAPAAPAAPVAPAAPAAPQEPKGQALAIKVVAVQGIVQVRPAPDQPWQRATVGMDLQPGWDIRTGLRSAVQFTIDGNHTVTVDRLGDVRVLEAIKKDGKVKTDVGMRYGRTEYKVDVAAEEHDSRIHSPTATLAVRGSIVALEDTELGCNALVTNSLSAQYTTRGGGPPINLVQGEINSSNEQGPQPPAQGKLENTGVAGAEGNGASGGNERLFRHQFAGNLGQGNGPGFQQRGFRQQEGLNRFQSDQGKKLFSGDNVVIIAPGSMILFVEWIGSADLSLFARDSLGKLISTNSSIGSLGSLSRPGDPLIVPSVLRPSGPATAIANQAGEGNAAVIIWNNGVPLGPWTVGVKHTSGPGVAMFNATLTQFPAGGLGTVIDSTSGNTVGPGQVSSKTLLVGPAPTGGSVPPPGGGGGSFITGR